MRTNDRLEKIEEVACVWTCSERVHCEYSKLGNRLSGHMLRGDAARSLEQVVPSVTLELMGADVWCSPFLWLRLWRTDAEVQTPSAFWWSSAIHPPQAHLFYQLWPMNINQWICSSMCSTTDVRRCALVRRIVDDFSTRAIIRPPACWPPVNGLKINFPAKLITRFSHS